MAFPTGCVNCSRDSVRKPVLLRPWAWPPAADLTDWSSRCYARATARPRQKTSIAFHSFIQM
jgi:hypothetical protein